MESEMRNMKKIWRIPILKENDYEREEEYNTNVKYNII